GQTDRRAVGGDFRGGAKSLAFTDPVYDLKRRGRDNSVRTEGKRFPDWWAEFQETCGRSRRRRRDVAWFV
ncbi:MAG: hypothetical protein WAM58_18235, partial [Candidatus Acidiferrum sp.]